MPTLRTHGSYCNNRKRVDAPSDPYFPNAKTLDIQYSFIFRTDKVTEETYLNILIAMKFKRAD
jgi:hypothetical protein